MDLVIVRCFTTDCPFLLVSAALPVQDFDSVGKRRSGISKATIFSRISHEPSWRRAMTGRQTSAVFWVSIISLTASIFVPLDLETTAIGQNPGGSITCCYLQPHSYLRNYQHRPIYFEPQIFDLATRPPPLLSPLDSLTIIGCVLVLASL